MSVSGPHSSIATGKRESFKKSFEKWANKIDFWNTWKRGAFIAGIFLSLAAVYGLGIFGAVYIIIIVALFSGGLFALSFVFEMHYRWKYTAAAKHALVDDDIVRGTEAVPFAKRIIHWSDVETVIKLMEVPTQGFNDNNV